MMRMPNPLHPDRLSPAERRAELCAIFARGLLRLRLGAAGEPSDHTGEIRLHNSVDRSRHATPTPRRTP